MSDDPLELARQAIEHGVEILHRMATSTPAPNRMDGEGVACLVRAAIALDKAQRDAGVPAADGAAPHPVNYGWWYEEDGRTVGAQCMACDWRHEGYSTVADATRAYNAHACGPAMPDFQWDWDPAADADRPVTARCARCDWNSPGHAARGAAARAYRGHACKGVRS